MVRELIPVIFRRAYECVRATRSLDSASLPSETLLKTLDYVTITLLIQQIR